MTYIIYFAVAVLLLLAGHYFRMLRWMQFITIYEQPERTHLLRSLGIGYAINFFIPFRVGDLVRAMLSGRRLKNGVSFSLSTIIIEHCLDIPFVCLVFIFLSFFNKGSSPIHHSALLYTVLSFALLCFGSVAIAFRKYFKKTALLVCSVFNYRIEYALLFFLWSLITSFKDIFMKINKIKLIGYSFCMWFIYLSSYYF